MKRWLLNSCTTASLLACLLSVALWIGCHKRALYLQRTRVDELADGRRDMRRLFVGAINGRLTVIAINRNVIDLTVIDVSLRRDPAAYIRHEFEIGGPRWTWGQSPDYGDPVLGDSLG